MGRLSEYLNLVNERIAYNGLKGLTIVDIDETLMKTYAMIHVLDGKTNKIVKKLDNQEFNSYKLKPGEIFDFREFRDAELFNKTSVPIDATVNRLKNMFRNIDKRGSKVILLTARSDFDNKEIFLDTFRKAGLNPNNFYVERAGNMTEKEGIKIPEAKKRIVMKYLATGQYNRLRMLDDHAPNIKAFLELKNEVPQNVLDLVAKTFTFADGDVIKFIGLLVDENGKLKRVYGDKEE